jgi:hypothetical protein
MRESRSRSYQTQAPSAPKTYRASITPSTPSISRQRNAHELPRAPILRVVDSGKLNANMRANMRANNRKSAEHGKLDRRPEKGGSRARPAGQ